MATKPAPSPSTASLIAEEVIAADPGAPPAPPKPAAERPSPIASAPVPAFKDEALVEDAARSTLKVVVTHGSLRHNGEEYAGGDTVTLPAADAKTFEAMGIVKILRRPA